jgi:hypothetical protein
MFAVHNGAKREFYLGRLRPSATALQAIAAHVDDGDLVALGGSWS